MRERWRFVPAGLMLAGVALNWNARSQAAITLATPLSSVLPALPGYRVQAQRLSADEQRVAGMSAYVARVYWRDSVPAFTTFVSYYARQTRGKTIHSPKNCLPGAGWEVLTTGTEAVKVDGQTQVLNRTLLKNGPATAVVFYWYQGRGRIVANEYAVKWNLLRDAAVLGHTEEALVRVVVPVQRARRPDDQREAARLVEEATRLGADISGRLTREVWRVMPRA